jgi:hypothetical protein
MIFKSRKDGFRWVISGIVFIIYAFIALLIYLSEQDFSALYGLAAVWLLLTIFIVWVLPATTRYTFLEDHLLCQSMGFKRRIYYRTFIKIEASNGLYAGWKMNTAWKCRLKTKPYLSKYLNKKKPNLLRQIELFDIHIEYEFRITFRVN